MNISRFIRLLAEMPSTETVANPYNCFEEGLDTGPDAVRQRQSQLSRYFRHRAPTARLVLVAEAPGFQGAHFTGIAMTSERLLSGKQNIIHQMDVFGREGIYLRTSHANANANAAVKMGGFAEPTATVVWKEIANANLHREVVLWNTFPFHPHRPNDKLTNRRPTIAEINRAQNYLTRFLALFDPHCQIVASGNVARDHLREMNIDARHVRHPANAGANAFREGIREIFRDLPRVGV